MACARCGADVPTPRRGRWCGDCERAYDTWSRRNAADIVWVVMSGGFMLAAVGMLLPLLGVDVIVAAVAALSSWATVYGAHRLNVRRRRRQFLDGEALPRAYLPAPK